MEYKIITSSCPSIFNVPKPTLADALKKRSSGFFEELTQVLIDQLLIKSQDRTTRQNLRTLSALDSTEARVYGHLLHFKDPFHNYLKLIPNESLFEK